MGHKRKVTPSPPSHASAKRLTNTEHSSHVEQKQEEDAVLNHVILYEVDAHVVRSGDGDEHVERISVGKEGHHRTETPRPAVENEAIGVRDQKENSAEGVTQAVSDVRAGIDAGGIQIEGSHESTDSEEEGFSAEDEEESEDELSSGSETSVDEEEDGRRLSSSTAFGRAFKKIMKKKLPTSDFTEVMGPMLSEHKQLISKKLEEAASEQKAKGEAKKERQAFRARGHTVPTSYVDPKEKFLIKLSTKGVVKLFNAVSKAQSIHTDAKPLKASDAKALVKQSKATFLAELRGADGAESRKGASQHDGASSTQQEGHEGGPRWSVLQDNFMLGKARLKDWDRREDTEAGAQSIQSSDYGSFSD